MNEAVSSGHRGPGCMTGKMMYSNKAAAIPVAKQFEQRIYVCTFCFQFHLTSQAHTTLTESKPVKGTRKK